MEEEISAGVQMMLDKLESDPDVVHAPSRLKTYSASGRGIEDYIHELTQLAQGQQSAMWWLTPRERDLLAAAFTKAVRHEFTKGIIEATLAPKEDVQDAQDAQKYAYREVMRMDSSGNIGIGAQPHGWVTR